MTNALRVTRLAGAAALLTLTACSSTSGRLIADYEVLRVPAAAARYPAGARWNSGTQSADTAAQVAEPVGDADGLSELSSADSSEAGAKLEVPILEWIGGRLGLESKEALEVKLEGLKHHFVADTALVRSRTVLLETITASSIVLGVDRSKAGAAEVSVDALAASLGPDGVIGVEASAESENTFRIRGDGELVVAIRVAEVEFLPARTIDAVIDLTTAMIGRAQEVGLGYRLTMLAVDPARNEYRATVQNPSFPGFQPVEVSFTPKHQLTWLNPNSEAIAGGDDPQASEAQFVWDTLTLQREADLQQSKLFLVRQYKQSVRTVDSGLDTL